ncbi:hypothetical protein N7532_001150 [Penicillium argentinense]|uniref:Uncharacterized protein n=1 Tax=Penicillium argentinense TaxID=1131581 RepID=A0A9W9G2U2_9EURO|nr:uncharacterized protein N7532_001150 [Penicillium argentinense]KAJ5110615.1 hypothetical protein N7532_001150 [Penicillium argentinense]
MAENIRKTKPLANIVKGGVFPPLPGNLKSDDEVVIENASLQHNFQCGISPKNNDETSRKHPNPFRPDGPVQPSHYIESGLSREDSTVYMDAVSK